MLKRVNVFLVKHVFGSANNKLTSAVRFNSSKSLSGESGNESSSFENYLISKIKMKGPLTVAEYMKEALGNPVWVCRFVYLIFYSFIITKEKKQ